MTSQTHPVSDNANDPDAFQASWQARALPAGARVRWIEIVSVIAEARSSVVYRATDHASDADIVLKEYMPLRVGGRHGQSVVPRQADDADVFARGLQAFLAEGQLLARVEHPSLVRVLDIVDANGTAYHVMPHVDGTSLLQLRQQMSEPPSDDALRALLDRLLGALQVLHEAGALHGKISPRKILVLENDRPLLLGPDLARDQTASDLIESLMANVEPSFAAPEQRRASPAGSVGPWSDFYSLASTLRYCISGEMPLSAPDSALAARGETMAQTVHRLFGDAVAKTYSTSLLDALDAALDPSPAGRPRDVAEFRAALAKRPPLRPLETAAAPAAPAHTPAKPAPVQSVTRKPAPEMSPLSFTAFDTAIQPAAPEPAAAHRARVEPAFDPRLMAAAPSQGDRAPAAPPQAAPPRAAATPPPRASAVAPREPVMAAMASMTPSSAPTPRPAVDHRTVAARRRNHGEFWAGAALASLIAIGAFTWWRNNQPVEFVLPTQPTGGAVTPSTSAPPMSATPMADAAPPLAATTTPLPEIAQTRPAPTPVVETAPPAVQLAAPAPAPVVTATPAPPPPNSSARVVREAPRQASREAARDEPRTLAAAPQKTASPRAACGERTPFALYRCMQSLCAQPVYSKHAQCERLRTTDSID